MKKSADIFSAVREVLHSQEYLDQHRFSSKDFTRKRILNLPVMVTFLLNLLNESIPKELHNFSIFCRISDVSRSGITQARAKLKPSAFVHLNDVLVQEFYTDNDFLTFNDHILIAVDGSTVQLPINCPDIKNHYGCISGVKDTEIPAARISCFYDILNGINVDAIIAPYKTGERNLAIKHVDKLKRLRDTIEHKFLAIFDRGYPSRDLIECLLKNDINFLMRCNTRFLKEISIAVSSGKKDSIVKIRSRSAKDNIKEFQVRVIIVTLSTGEKEILITSLLDKTTNPYKIFRELYSKRWGVEENFKFQKNELEIENFSGKTRNAVEQDFYATILAANAHALLICEASKEIKDTHKLSGRSTFYDYKVNKRVSLHIMKNTFVEILYKTNACLVTYCKRVKAEMKRHLIPIRPDRSFTRIRNKWNRRYHMNNR